MRKLYWKIFLSFWLATILIILTTAWITSEIAKKSSIPARERLFMDSFANAAVVTYEAGHHKALKKWMAQTGLERHMELYLLASTGDIISNQTPPAAVIKAAENLKDDELNEGLIRSGNLIVSHEILSTTGNAYRLAAVSEESLAHFVHIPWAGLSLRLIIAIFFSGLICYLLSMYLTQPLRTLRLAAKSIARGNLGTRVGHFAGHHKDEIDELSDEFNHMAEELEAHIHSKERLLQDISHELRSPLARLQMALEIGRKKTNNTAVQEFNRMEIECMRLNTLIGEILEYARLEQSTNTVKKSQIHLKTLLFDTIDDANFEFSSAIKRVKAGELHNIQLMADERLIRRAIENILRNALRYSPADQQVVVSLYDNTAMAIIEISDQGPGIPENELEKVFDPFYRVDSSREKKTGGFGLGLAIAQQAVKLHQGKIEATNSQQGGLTVKIFLPLIASPSHHVDD